MAIIQGVIEMDGIIKAEIISTLFNYFDKEKSERLVESNGDVAGILYFIIKHYEHYPTSGLDLDKLETALYNLYEAYKTVKESDLELLIQEGFLIKEDGGYFITKLYYKEKLRQEKENGQQFLFPDLMKTRLD